MTMTMLVNAVTPLIFICRFTQTNYDGSCKNTIAEGLVGAQPYGLQVFGAMNFMFWTDLSMKSGYNMMNTTFDGKTKSIHKDNDPKYGLRSFWDRNTSEFLFPNIPTESQSFFDKKVVHE